MRISFCLFSPAYRFLLPLHKCDMTDLLGEIEPTTYSQFTKETLSITITFVSAPIATPELGLYFFFDVRSFRDHLLREADSCMTLSMTSQLHDNAFPRIIVLKKIMVLRRGAGRQPFFDAKNKILAPWRRVDQRGGLTKARARSPKRSKTRSKQH